MNIYYKTNAGVLKINLRRLKRFLRWQPIINIQKRKTNIITSTKICLPDNVEQFCCHLGSPCSTEHPDSADAALGRFWVGATAPGPLTGGQALLARAVLTQNTVALCNEKQ